MNIDMNKETKAFKIFGKTAPPLLMTKRATSDDTSLAVTPTSDSPKNSAGAFHTAENVLLSTPPTENSEPDDKSLNAIPPRKIFVAI
jgi:hypothetical protein